MKLNTRANKHWRHLNALILLVVTFGLLAGCSSTAPQATPTETVASRPQSPTFLTLPGDDWGYPSPFAFYSRGPGYVRMSLLFDTLTWKDEEGVIPWLADDWTVSDDGITWTFDLRSGVTWHDGRSLTADDVAFTFEYFKVHRESVTWSWPLDKIAGAEAFDDQTVVLTLTEPLASAHEVLIGSLPIIPKHIWEAIEDPLKAMGEDVVIGSGPFTLTAYNKEEGSYIYDAYADYFNGELRVDSLVFIKVENEALALQTDTTDYASFWGKAIEAAKAFQDNPDYAIIEGPSYWVLQLIFNTTRPPFDTPELRRAIAHAVDRERIVTQVTHDGAIVAGLGILSPETAWHNPDLPTYAHDPAVAKQLLEEAGGLASLPPVSLITTANYAREAELIQADLAAVGLEVTIQSGDRGTVDGLLREGNFDLAINGHGGLANPAILRAPTWPATVYQNQTYDRLYQEQARTVDEAARKEMVWELQEIVATDLPVLTLWHPKMWTVYDPAKLDTWFYTDAGIGFGIPIAMNKLSFLQ